MTEQTVDLTAVREQLMGDFPSEAYSTDNSRGFPLTSIKAAYIFERLSDTFGLCGYGWRYSHTPVTTWSSGNQDEIILEVALQYRLSDDLAAGYCPPVVWDNEFQHWASLEGAPNVWSEAVFAHGGKKTYGKGSAPTTDAHKSALTDSLTKAASMLGIAHTVFKGQFNPDNLHEPEVVIDIPDRPMTPAILKAHLKELAKTGNQKAASSGQRKYVAGMIVKALDGVEGEAGPDLLEFIWEERDGVPFRSTQQLSGAQAGAMLNGWLLDKDNENILHSAALEEATAVVEAFRPKS